MRRRALRGCERALGVLRACNECEAHRPPRRLTDAGLLFCRNRLQRMRHGGTREYAALRGREVFADGLLHVADGVGERFEVAFGDGGQKAHQHEMRKMGGERGGKGRKRCEAVLFGFAVQPFARCVVDEQHAPGIGKR